MRKILLLLIILPFCLPAQVHDDFSDGDFTANPPWYGTDTSFMVNNSFQLQSAATNAGVSWLSTDLNVDGEVEWRFWIRENFSPSMNNYAEVWLSADTALLPLAQHGYFLRFGSSGSQDAIELYRKDPQGEQLVLRGTDAAIATSFKVAVKVNRDVQGRWTLATDYSNSGNYLVEAEGTDDQYPCQGYFGFCLKFTASNAKKFYFDEVYIGPPIIDTEPPELVGFEVIDPQQLLLSFNESLATTALDPSHYLVAPENKVPSLVSFDVLPSRVLLEFASALPQNTNLTLWVTGLCDLSGNILATYSRNFSIYQASENDVVINEIMADPSPVVGLPEWEYVELFNTTELEVDLKGWSIQLGNTSKPFPEAQIGPKGYLILCKAEAEPEFQAYGPTLGFSSFSITNAGTTLRLVTKEEALVSEVSFNDNWYHDADKKNGGWSLEQIDPYNPCAGALNWSASTDVSGGTPGRENAINAPNETPPQVARISMLGDQTVLLWFDQQMDRNTLEDPSHYLVEELSLSPTEVVCNPVENASLSLAFDYRFEEGTIYTLVLNGLESCSGQPILSDTKACFGIPNVIGEGEVLINEIMFDPISPGVDYVELYNYSDKTFDLCELKLGVIRESFPNPADTVLKTITDDSRLFLPGNYLLLSVDGYTVCQQYGCELSNYYDMASFPSYANSGGKAILMSRQGLVIDEMTFSEKMHYPLLKETKGVALERVSWATSSAQPDNWHSAAEAVHFGTPGYPNSMANNNADQDHPVKEMLTVEPKVFSPDGDGDDDCCSIAFRLDSQGATMNAYVFNAAGQLMRHLVKGALVAQEGSFVWNGLDSRGQRVPIGIYVVVTEVFDLEGRVRRYKNAVAVASR